MEEAPVDRMLCDESPHGAESSRTATVAPSGHSKGKVVWQSIEIGIGTGLLLLVALLATLAIIIPLAVGGSPLTVLTGSMEPTLPPGTLVVVKPTPSEDINVGDILTYQFRSGKPELVTHRVVQRISASDGTTSFITKGDNNAVADANPIQEIQIRGTVWYAIPYLGWVNTAVNGENRVWIVPVIAGGLFLYAGYAVASSIASSAKRKRSRRRARVGDGGDQKPEYRDT